MAQSERRWIPELINALATMEEETMKAEVKRSGTNTQKERLLDHYAGKSVNSFIQLDGNANTKSPEAHSGTSDVDGDDLYMSLTHELMDGANVRILIRPGIPLEVVLRLMGKIQAWLQREREERRAALRTEAANKLTQAEEDLTVGSLWGISDGLDSNEVWDVPDDCPF